MVGSSFCGDKLRRSIAKHTTGLWDLYLNGILLPGEHSLRELGITLQFIDNCFRGWVIRGFPSFPLKDVNEFTSVVIM